MKKIIALTTLLAASGAFAADTTSTTKIETANKSFKERISTWYYGEMDTDRVSNSEGGDKTKTDFLNYLNIGYEVNSKNALNVTLRMNVTDKIAGNGTGDRYEELDPRIGLKTTLMKTASSSLKSNMLFEIPMSRYSNDTDGDSRITRFKPSLSYSKTIDDYNSILLFGGFNKTIYSEASESVYKTSRHYVTSWISYTNSSLSEKYKFKIDAEGLMRHQGGTSDLNIKASTGEERILAGVNFDLAGTDIFAYGQHDPSGMKSLDTLGAGVQIFKSF